MILRRGAVIGFAVAALLAGPLASAAATSPTGFHATGTVVVQATVSGSPLNVGGNVALYQRASMYRLDLLSLAFPGTDSTAGAVAGALLAPGGVTVVYDGASGTVTAYSLGNHVYYLDAPRAVTPQSGSASTALGSGAADPLAALAGIARQLHDVQRAAIQLTGHSTVNGHPTDDLDVMVHRQRPGKAAEDYHAQLSLADDLDGFPVRIAMTSTPPSPQDFGGSARLDLTAIARETPAEATFALPPGLTRVNSIGEVLQAKH